MPSSAGSILQRALIVSLMAIGGIAAAQAPQKYQVWGKAGVAYSHKQLMEHGVWVTGDVTYDNKEGLMFLADKEVEGNSTRNLVYLAIPEDLAKSFGPMCYRAAEQHLKLRLCGAFLPHSSPIDSTHPGVNFVIWKLHSPDEPDELPIVEKIQLGPHDVVPGYTIVPKKP